MHRNKDNNRAPVWVNVWAYGGRCLASVPHDNRQSAVNAAAYVRPKHKYQLNSRVKVTFK